MRDQAEGVLTQDFLNKYDLLTLLIRRNNSCYAISAEWYPFGCYPTHNS